MPRPLVSPPPTRFSRRVASSRCYPACILGPALPAFSCQHPPRHHSLNEVCAYQTYNLNHYNHLLSPVLHVSFSGLMGDGAIGPPLSLKSSICSVWQARCCTGVAVNKTDGFRVLWSTHSCVETHNQKEINMPDSHNFLAGNEITLL